MQILNKEEARELLISTLPKDISIISIALNDAGFDCFLVGGSVRDAFFGKAPKDFDLCTNALPEQVIETLNVAKIPCEPRGVEFGIVVAKGINGDEYEIATFRSDISGGTGNLMDDQVILGVTIEDDVQRRDFTINGLFFDLDKLEIIDLVGGIEDLNSKIIRAIGNPVERFNEDSTRKLRAIRFATRYNFGIDTLTLNSIISDPSLKCNNERIMKELEKIFSISDCKIPASMLNYTKLTENIFKGCSLKKYKHLGDINSLSTYIATVIWNDQDNVDILSDIVKSTDIINNVKLLWELDVDIDTLINEVMVVDVLRKLKSCTLTMAEAMTFTQNPKVAYYFQDDLTNQLKSFNQEAIDKGLTGKEIGDWTKEKLQLIIKNNF